MDAEASREVGGIRINFTRRTRRDGDSLDLFEVPLGEDREEYRLEILAGAVVLRTIALTTSDYLYPSASELADFGALQSQIVVRPSGR